MGRIHLFEFEDLAWFPSSIRNYGTDFLQFLANAANIYKGAFPILEKAINATPNHQIIDLASGGGGGLIRLNSELKNKIPDLKILLTDYYPNVAAFSYVKSKADNIDFVSIPVNAMNVPPDLKGLRTQFLSFHHFRPGDAQRILQNAVDANQPIAIFEAQERSAQSFISMLFSPISVLLTTPFIRPFSLRRLLFTYLIPVVPFFVLWDGVVSCLRTYSVEEMQQLVSQLSNKDAFDWQIGKVKSGPGNILYLTGTPCVKN